MKYLKDFSAESDYLDYRCGSDYLEPNVSLCDDNGNVYYNSSPLPITYDYVDLGLPTGTKWATCNVGARKPSDTGLYFQWGDTKGYTIAQIGKGEGKKKFALDWSDYKWYDTDKKAFTKYATPGATLDLKDDVAHANMGGDWHMPTPGQIQELLNNTTSIWTTQDGVNGRLFTSKSDTSKTIFIPAVGYAVDGSVYGRGSRGYVWSSMLYAGSVPYGQSLNFHSGDAYLDSDGRYGGFSVRGVVG